ncbi:AaceriABR192CAp [[Ashbya] aceris (nom. inval.)]|nr:AaceriABR192CAp [[Ashbya] aceris (nom. inval.)]
MNDKVTAILVLVVTYSIVGAAFWSLTYVWGDETKLYYWCIVQLLPVMLWVWCVISWCGAQLFGYAKREKAD